VNSTLVTAVCTAFLATGCREGAESPQQAVVALAGAAQSCDGAKARQYVSAKSPKALRVIEATLTMIDEMSRTAQEGERRFGSSSELAATIRGSCRDADLAEVSADAVAAIEGDTATMLGKNGRAVFFVNARGWRFDGDRNMANASEEVVGRLEALARNLKSFREKFQRGDFETEREAARAFESAASQ
jgi:hypothetical protein